MDEIAKYDVPAMLQLVQYHSGSKGKTIYIGHSLASSVALMFASERPAFAKSLVSLFIFVGPAYKMTHMRSPYRMFFPLFYPALVSEDFLMCTGRDNWKLCLPGSDWRFKPGPVSVQGTLQKINRTHVHGLSSGYDGLCCNSQYVYRTVYRNCSCK